MPLTARVESGQSSPSFSTGGGTTAWTGVGVGAGVCGAGGSIGLLTSGLSPGRGVGAALVEAGLAVVSLVLLVNTTTTTAITMTRTSAATPSARNRLRR